MDLERQALQIITERHNMAVEAANKNLYILRSNRQFAALEGEIAAVEWEKAKREVYNEDYHNEEEKLVKLNAELESFFEGSHIKKADTVPMIFCKKCNDSGFCHGKLCDCVFEQMRKIQYESYPFLSELPDNLKLQHFEIYGKNKEGFVSRVKFLEENILKDKGISNFTLLGKPGIGKSYIAFYIAKKAVEKNLTVAIYNAIKLNKLFLEYHLADIEKKNYIFGDVTNCDLLIIDDLGVEQNLKKVTIPYLYQLIIERLGKKTIITTNLSEEALNEKYDQRIFSRLADKKNSAIILFKGQDLRI